MEHIPLTNNEEINSELPIVRKSRQLKNLKRFHARGTKGKKRRRTLTLMIKHWRDNMKKKRNAEGNQSEGESQCSKMSARKKEKETNFVLGKIGLN